MECISLVPVFAGKKVSRDYLLWEHEGNRALRIGEWKLVAVGDHGQDDVQWELYDLSVDRSELNDLSKSEPEKLQTMIAAWTKQAQRTAVLPWPDKSKK